MSKKNSAAVIEVAVAVLRDPDDRILLCRRRDDARYGGKWEFPGGKLETDETARDAARREVREELGLECDDATELHRIETRYDDGGRFAVTFFEIRSWSGVPRPLVAAELAWVAPGDLTQYDILEGSRNVCDILAAAATRSTSVASSSRT